jgi:hypothetical protein
MLKIIFVAVAIFAVAVMQKPTRQETACKNHGGIMVPHASGYNSGDTDWECEARK